MTHDSDDIDYSDEAWCRTERDFAAVSARKTLQGIVDHVFVSIMEQGETASTPVSGGCRYLIVKGNAMHGKKLRVCHCAAGKLFTDAELKVLGAQDALGNSFDQVITVYLPYGRAGWCTSEAKELIGNLQAAHDSMSVEPWAHDPHTTAFRRMWCTKAYRAVSSFNDWLCDNGKQAMMVDPGIIGTMERQMQEQGKW